MPGVEIKGRSKRANYRHGSTSGGYQPSGAKAMPKYFTANSDYYPSGGVRVGLKEGTNKKWIQEAFTKIKAKGTEGKCTGKKYGSKSCPPGSKAHNMAKNLRAINKKG